MSIKISPRGHHEVPRSPRTIMTDKIIRIADAIKTIETKMPAADRFQSLRSADKVQLDIKNAPTENLHAPINIYDPTNVRGTVVLFDDLNNSNYLPEDEIDAAVLGSVRGSFAMPLSIYFEFLPLSRFFVTGFEKNRDLADASRTIAKSLEIPNIRFINRDFMQLMRNDLKQFNLICIINTPYQKDLIDFMDNFLPRIDHGTLLLTRDWPRESVQRSGLFRHLYQPLEPFYKEEYHNEYHLYQRTNAEILPH